MAGCELVLFDCDGTLMDTELLAAEVEVEVLQSYGIELTAAEFGVRFAGTASEVVKSVMEEETGRHLPDDHIANVKLKMKERLWREAKAMDGAHDLLDRLDQPRAICSNADMEKLKIELSRAELWDRFRPYVFSAHDLPNGQRKPKPDLYLHAASEFEIAPDQCVVVEDSVAGVTAGKAAGMKVIGFEGGSHAWPGLADALTDAGADTIVKRLLEIPPIIDAFAHWDGF